MVFSSSVDPRPDALRLNSWDDMCTEGGITFVIFIASACIYMFMRKALAKNIDRSVTYPFYVRRDGHDQTRFFPRLLEKFEGAFVLPFVPKELDSFVLWIFFWFFITTMPMAINRYYKKRWENDVFALQGPFNLISHVMGCGMLNTTAIPYTEVLENNPPPLFSQPPPTEKYERIDWFIFFHLSIGMLWLCAGFLQIYKNKVGGWSSNREVHWDFHRKFGKVGFGISFLHTLMMTYITLENPLKQSTSIKFGYLGMAIQSARLFLKGVKYASATARSPKDSVEKKKNKKLHEMAMVEFWVKTIRGSGTIRISAWFLWFVGQFLPPNTRDVVDRSCCQTFAKDGIGVASDCWKPVFFNHFFMNFINDWLELLYIDMRIDDEEVKARVYEDKKKIWVKFAVRVVFFPIVALLILADRLIESWLEESVNLPDFLEYILAHMAEGATAVMIIFLFYLDIFFEHCEDWLIPRLGFLLPDEEAVKED